MSCKHFICSGKGNDVESTPTKKPVLSEVEVEPSKPTTLPPYEDIGGTEDLQDGSMEKSEKPEQDPEETSL